VTPPIAPSALPPRGAPPVAWQSQFHGGRATVISLRSITSSHAPEIRHENGKRSDAAIQQAPRIRLRRSAGDAPLGGSAEGATGGG